MSPNDHKRKKEGEKGASEGGCGGIATNEVLSEVHNASCTVLKDFSRVGVFLNRSQQKYGQGWVSGWRVSRAWL